VILTQSAKTGIYSLDSELVKFKV